MKYRTRTGIVEAILKAASDSETGRTRIMYRAFLSHGQVMEYLLILVENGLLSYTEGTTQTYKCTEKGRRFLKMAEQMEDLLKPASDTEIRIPS